MKSPVSSIIHSCSVKPDEPLNILCSPTHEGFQTSLCHTNHNFYSFWTDQIKRWVTEYRPVPKNYFILPDNIIPNWLDFHVVLSQNKFDQYQRLKPIADNLHLNLISVEHTFPFPGWNSEQRGRLHELRGKHNVFITKKSLEAWGWENRGETSVIEHGIDTDLFKPSDRPRQNTILTVANDYINRDWCLNFKLYKQVTEGLPTTPVGNTEGFSRAASSVEELIYFYQSSKIFLSTANISPIPLTILEAMACGLPVVATPSSAIPDYVEHGISGFLTNDPVEMRYYLELLLTNDNMASKMGMAGREIILEKFGLQRFVDDWNSLLYEISSLPYIG